MIIYFLQTYQDRLDYWYPAIRFRKEDDAIRPVRAKEQGDWKNLSVEEKKMCTSYSVQCNFRGSRISIQSISAFFAVDSRIID